MKKFYTKATVDVVGTKDDGLYIYITVDIDDKEYNLQYVANWDKDSECESEQSDYIDDLEIQNECDSLASCIADKFFEQYRAEEELESLLELNVFPDEQ